MAKARAKKAAGGPTLENVTVTPNPRAAPVAKGSGLPSHPGVATCDLLATRLGSEEPLRLPDAYGDLSCATVLRDEWTVTTDAAGIAVFAIGTPLTGVAANRLSWVVTAGVCAAAPAAVAHPQYAALNSDARCARQIGIKVQVTYIGAADNEAGYLSFQEYSLSADVNSATVDAIHTGSTIQVRPAQGLVCFGDFTQDPRWELPTNVDWMAPTFPVMAFAASGMLASTASFRVRTTRWIEYLPKEGSLSEGDASYEPHDAGTMSVWGMLNHPRTSVTTIDRMGDFVKEVRRVATAAFHIAQPLTPYIVPAAKAAVKEAMSYAKLLV